jgi:hypothetical protein
MTDIEERLADALNASYDAARALPLRQLSLTPLRPHRWVMLFAPLAAALAVVAVVIGLNALTRRMPARGPSTPVPVATVPAGTPRYYVDMDYWSRYLVRSVATGKVTSIVPVRFADANVAVGVTSADGVFYIVGADASVDKIYRFRLTSAGQVTGLAQVKVQGKLTGAIHAIAASPDGTKLAYTVDTGSNESAPITVISLPSGVQHTWRGGLNRPGYHTLVITSMSWMGGDENLAFTGLWCQGFHAGDSACVNASGGIRQFTEVRALNLAVDGHSLGQTKVLLRQSSSVPFIAAAAMSPDGATIAAVVLSGPVKYSNPGTVPSHLAVRQFSAATGRPTSTLYQRPTGPTYDWFLTPDGTGRYFLLDGAAVYNGGNGPPSLQNKGYNGLLASGKLINLPPHSGLVWGQAW